MTENRNTTEKVKFGFKAFITINPRKLVPTNRVSASCNHCHTM